MGQVVSKSHTERLQAGMVANERNVNALRLASLKNRHSFRNLVLVTVDLQRNKIPLSCYPSPQKLSSYQQQTGGRMQQPGTNV